MSENTLELKKEESEAELLDKIDTLNKSAWALQYLDTHLAISTATEALTLCGGFTTPDFLNPKFKALIILGWCSYLLSDYVTALKYNEEAAEIAHENGNKINEANAICNIGIIYDSTGDFHLALEFYQQALALEKESENKHGQARVLGNIGGIYDSLGQYETAIDFHLQSLSLKEVLSSKQAIATTLGNLGNVYCQIEQYDTALEYFLRTLSIHEEIDNNQGRALALHNIGNIYADPKYPAANQIVAIEYFEKSLTLSDKAGQLHLMFESHKMLAELFEKRNDIPNAFEHFKKFHALKEKVFSDDLNKQKAQLDREKKLELVQQEQLLTNNLLNKIFPQSVVERLRAGESPIADFYPAASVLFLDLVDFTDLSTKIPSRQLLYLLNCIFDACDEVVNEYGLEKIKTIGDAYMAASGVPDQRTDHLEQAARCSLKLLQVLNSLEVVIPDDFGDKNWIHTFNKMSVRIGLHTGEVVGGVIGSNKYAYDLWGDTVNTASRMESTGEPDMIHCTEGVYTYLQNSFIFEERGEMDVKGKGRMKTYFLIKEK